MIPLPWLGVDISIVLESPYSELPDSRAGLLNAPLVLE
jgi:hypothetical protein